MLTIQRLIDLPPQTCEAAQSSVSSQVQSYPPVAEQVEDADAGLQVQDPKADETNTGFHHHRLNGSSSPVLTATCLSYGSLCDFIFPPTDLEVTRLNQFSRKVAQK